MKPTAKIGILLAGAGSIVLCSYSVFLLTQPKQQAKIVLKRFLKACEAGDLRAAMHYSVLEELAPIWYRVQFGVPVEPEELTQELAEAIRQEPSVHIGGGRASAQDYSEKAAAIRQYLENVREPAQQSASPNWLSSPERAEAVANYLEYLDGAEAVYCYTLMYQSKGEWLQKSIMMHVVKSGGVWRVDPLTDCLVIPAASAPDENETEPES